jgi:hypothetical protein
MGALNWRAGRSTAKKRRFPARADFATSGMLEGEQFTGAMLTAATSNEAELAAETTTAEDHAATAEMIAQLCPGPPGRLSALSISLCKSVLYGIFVWARRALNSQKRRFPARAVDSDALEIKPQHHPFYESGKVLNRARPPPDH